LTDDILGSAGLKDVTKGVRSVLADFCTVLATEGLRDVEFICSDLALSASPLSTGIFLGFEKLGSSAINCNGAVQICRRCREFIKVREFMRMLFTGSVIFFSPSKLN